MNPRTDKVHNAHCGHIAYCTLHIGTLTHCTSTYQHIETLHITYILHMFTYFTCSHYTSKMLILHIYTVTLHIVHQQIVTLTHWTLYILHIYTVTLHIVHLHIGTSIHCTLHIFYTLYIPYTLHIYMSISLHIDTLTHSTFYSKLITQGERKSSMSRSPAWLASWVYFREEKGRTKIIESKNQ